MSNKHNFEGGKTGVLVVNLGSPEAVTLPAVRRFLREFLSDPRVAEFPRWLWLPLLNIFILPIFARRSLKMYQKNGSPLHSLTKKLTSELDKKLSPDKYIVSYAMRYGKPSIEKQLNELREKHITKLIVLPLYPQYSATTSGSVFDEVTRVLKKWRWVPDVKFVSQYPDNELYIDAIANSIKSHWEKNGRAEKLILSFHGLPKKYFDKGDPYYCYCHKSARLIREKLNVSEEEAPLVFQSRVGNSQWLEPFCNETLKNLGKNNCKSVDIICPGFAVDCLETIEEIAMTNKKIFLEAGGEKYHYIPALNAEPPHVELFMQLIK